MAPLRARPTVQREFATLALTAEKPMRTANPTSTAVMSMQTVVTLMGAKTLRVTANDNVVIRPSSWR
jgi:hypothetical protein